jgi:hypothetical protein
MLHPRRGELATAVDAEAVGPEFSPSVAAMPGFPFRKRSRRAEAGLHGYREFLPARGGDDSTSKTGWFRPACTEKLSGVCAWLA